MSIIGQVERHNWKVKLLNVSIHVILIIGASTMVYPLLLMFSGSVKSNVDFSNFNIIPKYLSEDYELFKKYLTTKYNNAPPTAFQSFKEPTATIDSLLVPEQISPERVKDYSEFLNEEKAKRPHYWHCIGMAYEQGVDALTTRNFRSFLKEKYGKDGLATLNKQFGTEYNGWNEIGLNREEFFPRSSVTNYSDGFLSLIGEFKESPYMTEAVLFWPDLEGQFVETIRRNIGRHLGEVNSKLGTGYNSWSDVTAPAQVPTSSPKLADIWTTFVKSDINPDFLTLDAAMGKAAWTNYLMHKYQELNEINQIFGTKWKTVADIELPSTVPSAGALRTEWCEFLREESTLPGKWTDFLKKKYKEVKTLNAAWGTKYRFFHEIAEPTLSGKLPASLPPAAASDLEELRKEVAVLRTRELPAKAIHLHSLANDYRQWLSAKFGGNVQKMNKAYGNGYTDFDAVTLPDLPPGEYNLAKTSDWRDFVKGLAPEDISLTRQATIAYKDYLKKKYTGKDNLVDFAAMSKDYGTSITGDNEIPAFNRYPSNKLHFTDKARTDYIAAIQSGLFDSMYRLANPKTYHKQWRDFLRGKYHSVDQLNNAWHLNVSSFRSTSLPSKEYEWSIMVKHRSELIKEYLKRNYLMVFDTLFMNGHAAANTLIYCFLAVLAALIVNPLCAYGLSRYKPAPSYKILLFLLLPMAFPGMVLGIPQFLLIKQFGLLNTFAALILPGMAQGYSIFLLKGFFDSLPKELFESAAIDGASEWCVFWNIAMSLSTPILSVIALGAFTGAYANFMLAFLLCQKESMWTMMVYLYQLQQRASSAVGFAALIIAAVPTLLVFIFCQNIIIKGIVVPTEK